MSVELTNFANGQMADAAAIMMAPVPAATPLAGATTINGAITRVVLTDTSGGGNAVTVYLVRSGGAPGPTNIIIDNITLPDTPYVSPELRNAVVNVGDALYGFATAGNEVNFEIDGFLIY